MVRAFRTIYFLLFVLIEARQRKPHNGSEARAKKYTGDLSLWIDEQQVKMYSGISMQIYAIVDGKVLPYILDPNFEKYLPIIPSEVGYVNFTWKSGAKKYFYNFDRLQSFDENILEAPSISINTEGRIPRLPRVFSVLLPCSGRGSGTASFGIGLLIQSGKGRPLAGTPLRVKMRKECMVRETVSFEGPDLECDKRCANGGRCDEKKICQCPEGYMGQYCKTALCYPACMNNGTCIAPGVCSCSAGFQGKHCEGGICTERCENGGKCVQKDICECSKGYYGPRCEFSKCIIPCLNGGRCKGVNKCRCPRGFGGDHCEVGQPVFQCTKPCRHGTCYANNTCICDRGWTGRLCNQRRLSEDDDDDASLEEEDDEELSDTSHNARKKHKIYM